MVSLIDAQGGRAIELMRAYYTAEDARNECPECENEGPWEECGPCSERIGDAINDQLLFLADVDALASGSEPGLARPDDDDLFPYLPEHVQGERRCGIQQSPWLTGWYVPWSPRNDNENAEGCWSHWVALAHEILKADAVAVGAHATASGPQK